MEHTIGKKLKDMATLLRNILYGISTVSGLAMIIYGIDFIDARYTEDIGIALLIIGIVSAGIGYLVATIVYYLMCGFGVLIETTQQIRNDMKNINLPVASTTQPNVVTPVSKPVPAPMPKSQAAPQTEAERLEKLENLRAKGWITEEEYQQARMKEQ